MAKQQLAQQLRGYLIQQSDKNGKRTTGSVLIDDGYIVQIGESIDAPDGATIIDASGLTAVPGLIDSHTHSYGSALADALRFGITSNIDMFSAPEVLPGARAQRESADTVAEADLFSAGMLATAPGGHGTQFGIEVTTLSDSTQAPAWVRARKDEGSDFIKLVYIPYQTKIPSLDRELAQAVIQAAHEEGLMAVAHISSQQAALDLVEDDIDGLVHVFADEAVSDKFVELAVSRNVFVIPTLAVIASVAGQDDPDADSVGVVKWLSPMQKTTLGSEFPAGTPGFEFELALNNVRRLHAAGVNILAGSDAPNPGTAHGYSLHHELKLLVDAGLSDAEAMNSATELPASIFKLDDRGALVAGKRADLLLVQGNPYQGVRASRQIKYIIKNGHVIKRVVSEAAAAPLLSSPDLGSFNENIEGPDGLSWAATDDGIMGGSSTAEIARVVRHDGGHALAVRAEIGNAFAYPWAGAGFGSGDPDLALDMSAYANIVIDIKGTPGTYRLMMFSGMGVRAPSTQEFEVSEQWQTVSLPLDKLPGFESRTFSMLSIVPGTAAKTVEYSIDEVRLEE